MMDFTRDYIKLLKKKLKYNIGDMLALDPKNDPFYIGSDNHKVWAEWLYGYWEKFGYSSGVHLRRLHYQLVSQSEPVIMPDGTTYENNKRSWQKLNDAAKYMRYLGFVNPNQLVDRRAPDSVCHQISDFGLNKEPDFSVDKPYQFDLDIRYADSPFPDLEQLPAIAYQAVDPIQTYIIELWCEKSTMNDILEPLCRRYNMNLVTGVGEMSLTKCCELVERVKNSGGKPCRIFYISDFDPAGQSMPNASARKIEWDARNNIDQLDIKLYPLALTLEQIQHYNLPRNEIKESEARKNSFESRHGEGATELDALEALYPGELSRIIQTAIAPYLEIERQNHRLTEQYNDQQKEAIAKINQDIQEPHKTRWQAVQDKYQELKKGFDQQFNELIESYGGQLDQLLAERKAIADSVESTLEDIFVDFPEQTRNFLDVEPEALLSTDRDYMSQIAFYKKFKGIGSDNLTDDFNHIQLDPEQ
jgi:hypothetical protein